MVRDPWPVEHAGSTRLIAQRAGEINEEVARVTGYTVPMIRAVLRSS